ncbi:MAG: DNA gyrase subunit B, partial [Desulfovibrio sp.]|nr:DNA gyrase subunit B [Desulfovibrio sp.]
FNLYQMVLAEGLKGINIQRYKGLGEMDPIQLWETTMNPAKRDLLQVSVEDAVAASTAFEELMGDQVEKRKQFIERKAGTVKNLDI